MHLESFATTDVGLRRRQNEDAHHVDAAQRVFAVADGMGGHAAGEVASAMAVECLQAAGAAPRGDWGSWLHESVQRINAAILERAAREPDKAGMGTTLTVLVFPEGDGVYEVAHVGDSRAYRLRGGALEQLTVDHTWVQQQVERGALTAEQARTHPLSSVLTRSLGVAAVVEPDLSRGDVQPGDLFLLCSDGLTSMVPDADLRTLLREPVPLPELGAALVRAANERGGADNITAVLVRVAA